MPVNPEIKQLFDRLSERHPYYEERIAEWQLFGEVLGDRKIVDKARYLPKGEQEDPLAYKQRIALAEWLPEAGEAIVKLTAAIYATKPVRKLPTQFKEFEKNCNRLGTHWDTFVLQACRALLAYGSTRTLVSTVAPRATRSAEPTVADEISQRAGLFAANFSPESVIDWEANAVDGVSMARLREEYFTGSGTADQRRRTRFVEFTRETIRSWVFREASEDGLELLSTDEIPNVLGEVPIVVEYFGVPDAPMAGKSFLEFSARAELQRFRSNSDLSYDLHLHAHPLIKAKTSSKIEELGIGSQTVIVLDPSQDEDLEYVSLPTTPSDLLFQQDDRLRTAIHRYAHTDPLGQLEPTGTFQASGVARAWSFETSEGRILSQIASSMASFELQFFRLGARLVGASPAEVDIQYPETFDAAAREALTVILTYVQDRINSPTLSRRISRRIALSLTSEEKDAVRNQILKEIDENPTPGAAASAGMDVDLDPDREPIGDEPDQDDENDDDDGGPDNDSAESR